MAETHDNALERIATRYLDSGGDLAVIHVRDDLIRYRSEVGWGILDCDLLALLQPDTWSCPRQPQGLAVLHHQHVAEVLHEPACRPVVRGIALVIVSQMPGFPQFSIGAHHRCVRIHPKSQKARDIVLE